MSRPSRRRSSAKVPYNPEGFERVFPLIGGHHLYQWLLLAVVALQGAILALHHVGYLFLGAVPDHWCQIEALEFPHTNWTAEQIKSISTPRLTSSGAKVQMCDHYDLDYEALAKVPSFEEAFASIAALNLSQISTKPCAKWTYDKSIYSSTVVTQYDLVCGRSYLVAMIQATYMAGSFAGSFVIGGLSDRILGRRNAVLLSVLLVIVCGFGAGISRSYSLFIIMRCCIAAGVAGTFQNCFTLMMEYSDTSFRAMAGTLVQIPFAVGYAILPVYAYFLRDWAQLQFAFSISTLALLSYYWIIPESSRWLATKGRHEEASKILQAIAKNNKMPTPPRAELIHILKGCKEPSPSQPEDSRTSTTSNCFRNAQHFFRNWLDLLRTPELRRRSIVLWILFISVTLVYYGISFDSALITDDPFLVVSLGGLIEIPGYLGVTPFVAKWGRRPTVASTFLLAGISSLLIIATPTDFKALRITFSMAGKMFISGTINVIYILGTELYPTTNRATGLGFASLMGRFGSILAPFVVNQLKVVYSDLPSIIFGVTGLLAGLLAFLLPETRNVEMVESISAIEMKSGGAKFETAAAADDKDGAAVGLKNRKFDAEHNEHGVAQEI